MSITIDATYEHGSLKPVHPLDLTEGSRVRLTIEQPIAESSTHTDPLADVIGICSGRYPDGADNHDKYIYRDLRK